MFSGIIEFTRPILSIEPGEQCLRLVIERPSEFTDLKIGDSVAVNGVCLTVEAFTEQNMTFALGAETIKVLELSSPKKLMRVPVNLERSLKFGDRIHGHLVSGHVDFLAPLTLSEAAGDSWILRVKMRDTFRPAIWKKGSLAIQGVSLTINEVISQEIKGGVDTTVEVCLIPETLKRTNLSQYKVGELLNIELDWMAKGLMASLAQKVSDGKSES